MSDMNKAQLIGHHICSVIDGFGIDKVLWLHLNTEGEYLVTLNVTHRRENITYQESVPIDTFTEDPICFWKIRDKFGFALDAKLPHASAASLLTLVTRESEMEAVVRLFEKHCEVEV